MSWLFDQPISIAAAGTAVVFLLVVAWVQTGRNAFLFSSGGAAVLCVLLLILERNVITPREEVEATVYELAQLVERNDVDAIVKNFVRSKPEWATKAKQELPRYTFTEARVTQIHHIAMNLQHQPPEAVVEMNVSVSGSFEQFASGTYLRWLKVTFWKEDDGRWRVVEYEHAEPTKFMRKD
jgi:ketosteroid isomerase-like protein